MPGPKSIEGLEWEDLAMLLAGIEHGSLNRAAKALRIGQATASRRLARLEERVSARLFDRTPEGLVATQFAHELAPHARLIEGHLADIGRIADGFGDEPEGRVRLALPDGIASAWLVQKLDDFYARYPKINLDLVIGNALVDLVRGEADIAFRFIPPTAADLIAISLGRLDIDAFVHPKLALQDPADLRWVGFLDPEMVFPETRWIHENILPTKTLRVSSWNAMFAGCVAGLGAALLSPLVAEPAGLVRLQAGLPPVPSRDVYLVSHRALRHVPRMKAVRDWLKDAAREFAPK